MNEHAFEQSPGGASDELKHEIKLLIIESLNFTDVKPEEIDSNTSLFEEESGLGIDSVDALEIVAALQRRYGVRIDDQNLGRFIIRTVDTIADFVAQELAKREQVPADLS